VSKSKILPEPGGPIVRRSSRFSQTAAEAARPCIQGQLIAWYARLLLRFRWYSLTDPGGMARWVGVSTHQPWAGFEFASSRSQVRYSTTRHPYVL